MREGRPMHDTPLVMPKMSMTMTEGELVAWEVAEGDTVAAGQVVCVVATDKVDMEVEAPGDGIVSRLVAEPGTVVPVGEPLAYITGESEDLLAGLLPLTDAERVPPLSTEPRSPTAAKPVAPTSAEPVSPIAVEPVLSTAAEPVLSTRNGRPAENRPFVPALPGARRRAAERGLSLDSIAGSGPGGAVTLRDVNGAERRSRSRAKLTERLLDSAAIPQFTVWRELDLERLAQYRGGLSWTTLLLRALAAALRDNPVFVRNTVQNTDEVTARHDEPHMPQHHMDRVPPVVVSVAVDSVHGLLTPSFTDPDRNTGEELDAQVRQTVDRARRGRIDPPHLVPGSVVLANLGALGAERFTAPVTPPQVAVLTVGAIAARAVVSGGDLRIRTGCTAGLTADHRVADGADAARLLGSLSSSLSSPPH
jgi:pyruvate dehydrogenase E2 component (dihydrolipoamide acetyltransferase)